MQTKLLWSALIAFLVTFAVFHAVGSFDIINCDDYDYLLNHEQVVSGLSIGGIRWAFANVEEAIWMPLTWISYMADRSLGLDFGAMHLHSLLWHCLNAALLVLLLGRLFPNRPLLVLFAALFWSVHPLRVESVAWLASRKDVISTFFFLLALLVWITPSTKHQALSTVFLLLGSAAKPSVMVFPAFALAIDFLILKRMRPWWTYAIIIVICGAIGIEAGWAQGAGGAMDSTAAIPLAYKLLNALAALTIYFGNVIWPSSLAPQCLLRYPALPRFSPLGALVLFAIGYWLFNYLRSITPYLSSLIHNSLPKQSPNHPNTQSNNPTILLLLLFPLSLFPFLGIVGFGIHAFADRFTLLPSIALSLAIPHLLANVPRHIPRSLFPIPIILVILFLSFLTYRQTLLWADEVMIFSHTLDVDGPQNAEALVVIGGHFYEFDYDHRKALDYLKRAIDVPNGYHSVGKIGDIFMECACVSGDRAAQDDCLNWLDRWNREQEDNYNRAHGTFNHWDTTQYLVAKALRLAYRPDFLPEAEKQLADLRRRLPNHTSVRRLAYRLALLKGNADEIAAAHAACADVCGDTYFKNRWARLDSGRKGK